MDNLSSLSPMGFHGISQKAVIWWRKYHLAIKITFFVLLTLTCVFWVVYNSRQVVKARFQTWLVGEQVGILQKSDQQLAYQSRTVEEKLTQLEQKVNDVNQQFASDRTQTVALQDQLKETVQEVNSVEPAVSPRPASSSPKAITSSQAVATPSPSPEASSAAGTKININSATVSQLDSLPGIGATYAQRIVEYREQNGAYKSVDDLLKVKGIGTSMLSKIRDLVEI